MMQEIDGNKVRCMICGFEGMHLITHIPRIHNVTLGEYKQLFPNSPLSCNKFKWDISKRFCGSNNPMYGKSVPEEVRSKISISTSGEKHWAYGRVVPREQVARQMASFKANNDMKGESNPFYGKRHSEVAITKMRTKRSESFRETMRLVAKNRSPMSEETKAKISKNMQLRWADENSVFHTQEYWKLLRQKLYPNKLEESMQHILDDEFGCGIWSYVGNRSLMIGNGHRRNPDFKHTLSNRLIEVYNIPDKIMTYGTLRRFKWVTTHHYKSFGYQVIYFSKKDIYFCRDTVIKSLHQYMQN